MAWERPTFVLRVISEPHTTSERALVLPALRGPCLWGRFTGGWGGHTCPERDPGLTELMGPLPPTRGQAPGTGMEGQGERRAGQQEPRWGERNRAGPTFQLRALLRGPGRSPGAVVTNGHGLGGLKQQKCVLSRRPEVRNPGVGSAALPLKPWAGSFLLLQVPRVPGSPYLVAASPHRCLLLQWPPPLCLWVSSPLLEGHWSLMQGPPDSSLASS